MSSETETPNERAERHAAHQQMLDDHKQAKHTARERHRNGWHKRRICPINLL